jgi:chromosome segregation ATPase
LDVYVRHIKSLETAFTQMSEATGISSVEEVVTTFIKSEEQKYSVAAYINELTAEIDQIEENNRNTKKAIERCKEISSSGEKRVKEIMADLNGKYEKAMKKKENRQMQAHDLKETLMKLVQPVKVTPT